ncbi:DBINO domain, partial [Dillenia turbinata]
AVQDLVSSLADEAPRVRDASIYWGIPGIHFWFLTVALLLHVEAFVRFLHFFSQSVIRLFGFESESWEYCWFVSSYGTCGTFFLDKKDAESSFMSKLAKIATAEIVPPSFWDYYGGLTLRLSSTMMEEIFLHLSGSHSASPAMLQILADFASADGYAFTFVSLLCDQDLTVILSTLLPVVSINNDSKHHSDFSVELKLIVVKDSHCYLVGPSVDLIEEYLVCHCAISDKWRGDLDSSNEMLRSSGDYSPIQCKRSQVGLSDKIKSSLRKGFPLLTVIIPEMQHEVEATTADYITSISPHKLGNYLGTDFASEYMADRTNYDSTYLDIGEGFSYRIPPPYEKLAQQLYLPTFSDIRGLLSEGEIETLSTSNSVQKFILKVSDAGLNSSSIPEGAAGGIQTSILSKEGQLQIYYVKVLEKGDTYEIIERSLPKKQPVKKDSSIIEKEEMEKVGKVWARNKVSRSLRLMRGASIRTRKLAELRKKEEKEAVEASRREQELRAAKRQQQRPNFLLSQTELYSHFMQNKSTSQPSEALSVGGEITAATEVPLSPSDDIPEEEEEDAEEAKLKWEALRATQDAVSKQ